MGLDREVDRQTIRQIEREIQMLTTWMNECVGRQVDGWREREI